MGIDFKVNFKTKITVNGKEYGSVEEVPEQHRQTVQNALSTAGTLGGHSKITVNGVGYDSPEAMPSDARRVYEESLAKAEAVAQRTGMTVPRPQPGAPVLEGALSRRTKTILLLLAGLAILLKLYAPK